MEYLLQLFGEISFSVVLIFIAGVIFLVKCYKKIEKYFTEKAVADKEKDEQIQSVIDQAKQYPIWHQQSVDIQAKIEQKFQIIEEKVEKVNSSVSELREESKEDKATTSRHRILRFDDEVRHDQRHSKEHFNQILKDIKEYKDYCRTHEDYENDQAVFAIENIEETYRRCVKEHTFL